MHNNAVFIKVLSMAPGPSISKCVVGRILGWPPRFPGIMPHTDPSLGMCVGLVHMVDFTLITYKAKVEGFCRFNEGPKFIDFELIIRDIIPGGSASSK